MDLTDIMQRLIVIGITDNPKPWFPPEVLEIIRNGKVFSGGKRHHGIVAPLLPEGAEWIDITVPLDDVFERYRGLSGKTAEHCVVVFASGDPLFFGFANTIRRKMPDAEIAAYARLWLQGLYDVYRRASGKPFSRKGNHAFS